MHTLTMRQGLAPSPWKKRVVSIGHLLLPFLDCRAVLAHAAGLALYHPFGAFSLAPLSFAVVGNCVGVQEYKGSFFLSFSQPALSFACHLASLLHVSSCRSTLSLLLCFFWYGLHVLLPRKPEVCLENGTGNDET